MKNKMILMILLILFAIFMFVLGLEKFEIAASQTVEVNFIHEGNSIQGTLYLPETPPPYTLAFFIHGDGPEDRLARGGYTFLMNHLLKENIACFSYDKPGVGESEGQWLSQTMEDRSKTVQSAFKSIENTINISKKGVIAFSQGGWVVSELGKDQKQVDFYIVIGGAIDWMDQHMYYERETAKAKGYTGEEITQYLNYVNAADAYIVNNDYEGYVSYVNSQGFEEPMEKQRFDFVVLNQEANAIDGLGSLKAPFLGVFGASDKNVNIKESYRIYDETFKSLGKKNYELIIFKGGTHSLIKEKYAGKDFKLLMDSYLKGKDIFVENYFEKISHWIHQQ